MDIATIRTAATRTLGRSSFVLKKHSPEILITTGIIGLVAGTVIVCKASSKNDEVLDTAKEKLDKIHKATELGEDKYSKHDRQRDLVVTYSQTAFDFVKLYGPGLTLAGASIVCILSSQNILKKRNLALAAAYKAVEKGFSEYRKRVVDEYGQDKDLEFRYGMRKEKIEELEVDPVTGKSKKVKKLVNVISYDPNKESIYARFFDESCDGWSKTPEYNLIFLKAKQNYANNMLHARGHLFLNEVYDELGIPRSQAGQAVGWIMDKAGDNYVSFGLTDVYRETSHNFVNGHERSVLLDFNVDGPIAHLIEEKKKLEGTGLDLVGSGNP